MHRITSTTATRVVPAALLALALAACGSDTSDPAGDDTSGGDASGSDASAATLTDEPFCDQVDLSMVGEVLGMPADKVRAQVDREVGEEFQGPVDEAKPATSVANLCVFGSSTSQFTVSVQPDAAASDVQEVVDDLSGLSGDGSSESCESGDAPSFGDPAAVFTCETGEPLQRVRVVATGLVGDSKFYCAAVMNQGAGADFEDKVLDACSSTLGELSSEA